MSLNIDQLKKKIIYRSNYRGTKEMDKLLGTFVKTYIDNLNEKDLINLEKLLEVFRAASGTACGNSGGTSGLFPCRDLSAAFEEIIGELPPAVGGNPSEFQIRQLEVEKKLPEYTSVASEAAGMAKTRRIMGTLNLSMMNPDIESILTRPNVEDQQFKFSLNSKL
mgnify:CR=1 FL=1